MKNTLPFGLRLFVTHFSNKYHRPLPEVKAAPVDILWKRAPFFVADCFQGNRILEACSLLLACLIRKCLLHGLFSPYVDNSQKIDDI